MGFGPFDGFGAMFTIVPVFIGIVFVIMVVTIIANAVRGAKQWKRNNDSPVLTVDAVVVAKRTDVSHHHHTAGTDNTMHHTTSSTFYYVTFQVPSGDRMEFAVRGTEYGMLAEGDSGKLTFQGTRYLGFERIVA